MRVILITDPAFADELVLRCVYVVGASIPPGSLGVQLRDKQRSRAELRLFASKLRGVTSAVGASLMINGDAILAREVGADGVHLGRDAGSVEEARRICGESTWVSVAAHSDDAVKRAVAAGASAVLVSPVFDSRPVRKLERSERADEEPGQALSLGPIKSGRGLDALGAARAISGGRLAVFALGGVTADNARSCMSAGADGVAVLRAILSSDEPARVARVIHDAVAERC